MNTSAETEPDTASESEQAATIMRQAMKFMGKFDVAMSPRNYAIWYEYAAGNSQALKEDVDAVIMSETGFSPEQAERLYHTYITRSDVSKVESMQNDFEELMTETITHIGQAEQTAAQSSDRLHEKSTQLNNNLDAGDIQMLLQDVMAETRAMAENSQRLQQRLNETTAQVESLKAELENVKQAAVKDTLTELLNRGAFESRLQDAAEQSADAGVPVSVIIMDVDNFNRINQEYGYLVGDKVLRFIGSILSSATHGKGEVCRFGGDEFAIMMPGYSMSAAADLAEQINNRLKNTRIKRKDTGTPIADISASVGVGYHHKGESINTLLQRVEVALYTAHEKGGDRVIDEASLRSEMAKF